MEGKWAHAHQVKDVPITGGKADVERLDMASAIKHDRIPNPLIGIAIKAEQGFDPAESSTDDARRQVVELLELKCEVLSKQITEIRWEDGTKDTEFTPEDIEQMLPEDRDYLFAIVTHIVTRDPQRDMLVSLMDAAPFRQRDNGTQPSGGGKRKRAPAKRGARG